MKKYTSVEAALKDGFELHAFSSGGRLRVLSLTKGDKKYYGESVDFKNALRVLTADVKAGGREYSDVYGPIEPHYLTGKYPVDKDQIDLWLYAKSGFDVSFVRGEFAATINETKILHTPKKVTELVFKNNKSVQWKFVGKSGNYTSSIEWMNGNKCCTTKPPKDGSWVSKHKHIGIGRTMIAAIKDAIKKGDTELEFKIVKK